MSKRYSKLFSLPENLYTETSPVIILAGALLKDTQTGKILAQLKFKNIDRKNIKALTVKLSPLDTTQKPLGEEVSHQYLDLNAPRDIEFGEKEPILLPDTSTRAFSASVTEVVFSDSTIWTADIRNTWTVIPSPIPLETALGDKELVKQYQIKYGGFCQCMFQKERDLWRCSCGEINHADEPICNRCKKEKDILSTVNLEELKKEKEERLIAESKYAAEKREAAVAHSKKVKKRIIKNAPICILLIAIIIMVSNNLKKTSEYNKALDLMEAKDYIQAASIFEKLDNYKDSNEQYQTAIKKAFPLKPIYEVVSKDGNAQEQIKLLGLRNTSFSGHELALDFVDSNQIKSTIYVKDNSYNEFWTKTEISSSFGQCIVTLHYTYTNGAGVLEYYGTLPDSINYNETLSTIYYHGSIDAAIYSKNSNLEISGLGTEEGIDNPNLLQFTGNYNQIINTAISNSSFPFIKIFLKQYVPDLSLSDLGFTSYTD